MYLKVESHNTRQMKPHKEKCELALDRVVCQEDLEQFAKLIDDEELELQELRAGPNPVTCSAHFATNGLHGCSLCKGWFGCYLLFSTSVILKSVYSYCCWFNLTLFSVLRSSMSGVLNSYSLLILCKMFYTSKCFSCLYMKNCCFLV